jgi:hypothetical protein
MLHKVIESRRLELSEFIHEFNLREYAVRISKDASSFDDYISKLYQHKDSYGTGFVVNNRPVPYFHPNRSFHDEIIWLNRNLYYNPEATFEDKLFNSAIVKFYGPSRTLNIITGHEPLNYLHRTDKKFIQYDRLVKDIGYLTTLCENIDAAFSNKEKIWGTTELRTSLQTAARNYMRETLSYSDRPMHSSDMIYWLYYLFRYLKFDSFYKAKPTMQQSFEFLTQVRGIGNYYGYHFSSNLARMPGIGHGELIEKQWTTQFSQLGIQHGNLSEDDDYVIAGPGALDTLEYLVGGKINQRNAQELLVQIRNNQEEFFGFADKFLDILRNVTELGRFTTFGCEIACCQFSVFRRLKDEPSAALKRASAPISMEVGQENKKGLENFFD